MYISTTVLTTLVALSCTKAAPLNNGGSASNDTPSVSASIEPVPSATYSLVPSDSASSSPDDSDDSLKVGSILSDLGITLPSGLGDKLNDIDLSPYADLNVTAFLGSVGIEITPETTLESLIADVREWKAGEGSAPSLSGFWNSGSEGDSVNDDDSDDRNEDDDDESSQDGWGWWDKWGRKHHWGHGHGHYHNETSTASSNVSASAQPSTTSYFGPGETPVGPSGEFGSSSVIASTSTSSTSEGSQPSTTSYFGPGETPVGPSGEFSPSSTTSSSAAEETSTETTSYFGPGETPVGPSGEFGSSSAASVTATSSSSFNGQIDVGEPTPISTVTDDDVGLPGPTLRV
ncbi:hypothetical protein I317_00411 [Kwoniella heveanensis CBS 569]|nr:hypothetical protein I317_00411 [Kwoniella heveanensis CBS 569]